MENTHLPPKSEVTSREKNFEKEKEIKGGGGKPEEFLFIYKV
jgi:hypothetical protein